MLGWRTGENKLLCNGKRIKFFAEEQWRRTEGLGEYCLVSMKHEN